ncbi:MAG: phosphatase PAP2 family protein [Chitinophagaceae bacterium]|nr:phosphatase PAP2 family protein [Chitinophagaceae bacterium]
MPFSWTIKNNRGGIPPAPGRFSTWTAIFAFVFFVVMTILVAYRITTGIDQSGFAVSDKLISRAMSEFMLGITFFGNHKFLIPANLILLAWLLFKKEKVWALFLLFCSLGGLLLKMATKGIMQRLRPSDPLIEGGVSGFSFPSGHALMSVVFYGWLMLYGQKRFSAPWQKTSWNVFMLMMIAIVSFSRIYLHVHYLSDVVAGLGLGLAWYVVSRKLILLFKAI